MVLAGIIFPDDSIIIGILAIVVVIGHNYSIWLHFHGGRGLATSAGVLIIFAPLILGIWLICWLVVYIILRQIIFASVISTFGILIFLYWPHEKFVTMEVAIPISIVSMLVIIKHIPRIKDVWSTSFKETDAGGGMDEWNDDRRSTNDER